MYFQIILYHIYDMALCYLLVYLFICVNIVYQCDISAPSIKKMYIPAISHDRPTLRRLRIYIYIYIVDRRYV